MQCMHTCGTIVTDPEMLCGVAGITRHGRRLQCMHKPLVLRSFVPLCRDSHVWSTSALLYYAQGGSAGNDLIFAVAIAEDGSVVLAGRTNGSWVGENAGQSDFAAVKLQADGKEIWRWQVLMICCC